MAVQWGIASFADGTYGLIQSWERTNKTEIKTYPGVDGNTAGYKCYEAMEEISLDLIYDSGQTPPAEGTTFTVSGDKFLVTEVGETETVDDWRKVKLTAQRWKDNTIPA